MGTPPWCHLVDPLHMSESKWDYPRNYQYSNNKEYHHPNIQTIKNTHYVEIQHAWRQYNSQLTIQYALRDETYKKSNELGELNYNNEA